jgi:hypothetical protein
MLCRIALIAVCLGTLNASCMAADSQRSADVFLEPACPSAAPPLTAHAAPLATIGELLLTTVIGTAVDAAGAYLSSAATSKSVALVGSTYDQFYEIGPTGGLSLVRSRGCLVIVARGSEQIRPWFARARERAPALRAYDRLPQLYFEAAFERAPDAARALVIRPQFFHIAAFQESSGWSYKDTRKYSIALTLRNREDAKPFGAVTFSFDEISPGTIARSRVIQIRADGTEIEDGTIQPSLNSIALEQRVDWLPVNSSLEAASKTQALAAAPYLKAARIANGVEPDPPTPVVEWIVRSGQAGGTLESAFIERLKKYCDSLSKNSTSDQLKDARCPVTHLQAANDLEEASAALQTKLDREWSAAFMKRHPAECKLNAAGKVACLPQPPVPSTFGEYAWEAAVVETRDPTAFATALASAFASKKDKIKSDLEEELLPSKREQARLAAETAKREATNAFNLAMLKVDEAKAKLDEAAAQPRSAQVALQAELLSMKIAANAAARTAKVAEPFPM